MSNGKKSLKLDLQAPQTTSGEEALELKVNKEGGVELHLSQYEGPLVLSGDALAKAVEFLAAALPRPVLPELPPQKLLTSHEVGDLIQMDPSSVVKWVNDGILPAYRTPGGHRRIRAAELHAFLKSQNMMVPFALQGAP